MNAAACAIFTHILTSACIFRINFPQNFASCILCYVLKSIQSFKIIVTDDLWPPKPKWKSSLIGWRGLWSVIIPMLKLLLTLVAKVLPRIAAGVISATGNTWKQESQDSHSLRGNMIDGYSDNINLHFGRSCWERLCCSINLQFASERFWQPVTKH